MHARLPVLAFATAIFMLPMLGGLAHASGSIPPTDNGAFIDRFQQHQLRDSYQEGQAIYLERIACGDCPLPGGVSNVDAARVLVARLKAGEFELRRSERNHLRRYVERRWQLR
ncbi:MAG: hypothetical protein ACT4NL_08660 [Pseudomarimonas sp.]